MPNVLIHTLRSRWKDGPLTAFIACAVFLLNAFISRQLFRTEFIQHMFSVEGSYIALTRYVMQNWRDLSWFPLWNDGEPFQATYQPGLPLLSAFVGKLLHTSPAHGYHVTISLLYCLGAVGVFLLAYALSGRRDVALVAALLYSLLSPSGFLVPVIRYDMGSMWFARRFQALVYYGEGPNVGGLSLVPFGLLGIHAVYQRLTGLRFFLAAVMLAVIVLVSWPASLVLGMGAIAYLLAQDWTESRKRLVRVGALACAAYLLIAPLDLPSTIADNQRNSQLIGGPYHYTKTKILYLGLLALTLLASRFLFRRFRIPSFLQFSFFWFLIPGTVALAAHWFKVFLIPQPERFHVGMEFGIDLLIAGAAVLFLSRRGRLYDVGIGVLLLGSLVQTGVYARYAKQLAAPRDVYQTLEYQAAHWMDTALPGQRVFLVGSTSLWMNIWSDQPQVGGCCLPGMPNPMSWLVSWQIMTGAGADGHDAELSLLWMRTWGAQAVMVNGPHTRDSYQGWAHPEKFEGILPKIWEQGDDRIYRIPSRTTSLAHVIRPEEVIGRSPVNGLDTVPMLAYVRALEDPARPLASFTWVGRHDARIEAEVGARDLISVQETWLPGWRASVSGRPVEVKKDGMGFMVIDPHASGRTSIDLFYDGGRQEKLLRWACLACWIGLLEWVAISQYKRRGAGEQHA